MKEYLKMWPYPPQTQYKVGQVINSELNGIQERCEVQVVDCSLIQVLFQVRTSKHLIIDIFMLLYLNGVTDSSLCFIMFRKINIRNGSTGAPYVCNT